MAQQKPQKHRKYVGSRKAAVGGVVVVKWVRHWLTGKKIYPVKAKALAFIPEQKKAS